VASLPEAVQLSDARAVELIAERAGKSVRSIVAKLSREGVYKAKVRTTKTGDAIVKKDTAAVEEYLQDYLELNPDGNALQADLSKKLDRATLTPEQRDMINQRTILQVQKVKRLMDARN
jgi:hypothetical protein